MADALERARHNARVWKAERDRLVVAYEAMTLRCPHCGRNPKHPERGFSPCCLHGGCCRLGSITNAACPVCQHQPIA